MQTRQLREQADTYLFRNGLLADVVPAKDGPILARGDGSLVWDTEGKAYLDFNSGQMCSALGHNHPRIIEALEKGLRTLTHASSVYYNVPQIELAAKLAETMDPMLKRTMFIQSGADSNEAAILVARRATGRRGIGAFHLSFHGYTDTTRAISFCAAASGYGPSVPDVYAIPAPYAYRSPLADDNPDWWQTLLKLSFELLDKQCPNDLAAVMVEPLISAGGVIPMPSGYLAALREELHTRGALLIFDEAQTGLGKLGSLYAYEQEGAVPDIITLSKHFGGGLAVSAMVTTDEIEAKATAGGMSFGHSHSSDPITCTAGLASLEVILEENVAAKAQQIGAHWQQRLSTLQQRYEVIGDIRGRGCLQGVELVRDRHSKTPATAEAQAVYRHGLKEGLMFSVRGLHGNVMRFVPPFCTTEEQLDRATDILEGGIKAAFG